MKDKWYEHACCKPSNQVAHREKGKTEKQSLLTHIFICCQGSLVQNTTQSGASSNPSPTQTSCPWDRTPLDAPSGGSKWDLAKLGSVKFSIRGPFYAEDLVLTLRKRKKKTFSLLRTAVCGLSSQSEKKTVIRCSRLWNPAWEFGVCACSSGGCND